MSQQQFVQQSQNQINTNTNLSHFGQLKTCFEDARSQFLLKVDKEEFTLGIEAELGGAVASNVYRLLTELEKGAEQNAELVQSMSLVLKQVSWDYLHVGHWKDVKDSWRDIYCIGSFFLQVHNISQLQWIQELYTSQDLLLQTKILSRDIKYSRSIEGTLQVGSQQNEKFDTNKNIVTPAYNTSCTIQRSQAFGKTRENHSDSCEREWREDLAVSNKVSKKQKQEIHTSQNDKNQFLKQDPEYFHSFEEFQTLENDSKSQHEQKMFSQQKSDKPCKIHSVQHELKHLESYQENVEGFNIQEQKLGRDFTEFLKQMNFIVVVKNVLRQLDMMILMGGPLYKKIIQQLAQDVNTVIILQMKTLVHSLIQVEVELSPINIYHNQKISKENKYIYNSNKLDNNNKNYGYQSVGPTSCSQLQKAFLKANAVIYMIIQLLELSRVIVFKGTDKVEFYGLIYEDVYNNLLVILLAETHIISTLDKIEEKPQSTETLLCEGQQAKPIQVIEGGLSLEKFEDVFVKSNHGQGTPCIISNSIINWPAQKKWNDVGFLIQVMGCRTVPVEVGAKYTDESWGQQLMSFGRFLFQHVYLDKDTLGSQELEDNLSLRDNQSKYISIYVKVKQAQNISSSPCNSNMVQGLEELFDNKKIRSSNADIGQLNNNIANFEYMDMTLYVVKQQRIKGYLAQHTLFDQIPYLKKDVLTPDLCCLGNGQLQSLNMWFGPPSTITPLHTDPYMNIFCQVYGKKYVRVYSPQHTSALQPYEDKLKSNTSSIDLLDAQCRANLDIQDLPYYEHKMVAGQMLFIPTGWWHFLSSQSPSISISYWFL